MIPSEVAKELQKYSSEDILAVGIGNELRGDDAIGIYIARKGLERFPDKFIDAGMAIENYIFKILGRKEKIILLIDAVDFKGNPGDAAIIPLEDLKEQGFSTHTLSLGKIKQFFLDSEKELILLGIQPENIALGSEMGESIREAGDQILELLRNIG
ncbi:hydrogenase maturation protease [bacterium]|nr:hydrogenase maturation protease [bacterium]